MCRPNRRSQPHLFHKKCYHASSSSVTPTTPPVVANGGGGAALPPPPAPKAKKMCPHCESTEQPLTVQLKLSMSHVPFHLLQSVSKMSFPKNTLKKSDLILKRDNSITYKMGNGKIISSEGMPEGVNVQLLGDILEKLEDKQTSK